MKESGDDGARRPKERRWRAIHRSRTDILRVLGYSPDVIRSIVASLRTKPEMWGSENSEGWPVIARLLATVVARLTIRAGRPSEHRIAARRAVVLRVAMREAPGGHRKAAMYLAGALLALMPAPAGRPDKRRTEIDRALGAEKSNKEIVEHALYIRATTRTDKEALYIALGDPQVPPPDGDVKRLLKAMSTRRRIL